MRCPFCEQDVSKFHPNSDVVPDWLYKHSFKNNKNFKSYGVDFKEKEIKFKQSAFKGSFVCCSCEGNFGKSEGYARLVFGEETNHEDIPNIAHAGKIEVQTQFGPHEGFILVGLDFKKFQKFVLGVILKGHMAKTGETSDLLGDKHFQNMRRVYLDDSQEDDLTYPIFMFKFDAKQPLWNMVSQPCRTKSKEVMNLISFKGGGYEFNVNVQSHPRSKAEEHFRFKKNGHLLILRAVQNFVAIQRRLLDAKKMKRERWGS